MSDSSNPEKDELTGSEQPFIQHLKELRDRLVKAFIAVALACMVLSVFPGPSELYDYLAAPLVATYVAEPKTMPSLPIQPANVRMMLMLF